MVLEFVFKYASDSDVFVYLLRYYAKDFSYELHQDDEEIIFKIQAEQEKLLEFCTLLERISNSVFLGQFEIKESSQEFKQNKTEPKPLIKKDFLSFLNSNAYLNAKELVKNEWDEFVNMQISLSNDKFEIINTNSFFELLQKSFDALIGQKNIYIQDDKGIYELGLFKKSVDFSFLMPTDIKAINVAFSCSNDTLKLLASIEKPLMSLRFNKIFKQNHELEQNQIDVKFADNLFLFALTQKLFESGYKLLGFKRLSHKKDEFKILECEGRMLVLKGFDYILPQARELIFSKEDKNMARLSYIGSKFKQESLILELSKDYTDILLANKEQNLLKLNLAKDSKALYEDICADEVGKKLLSNFAKNFPLLEGEFELKNNFFSLLGLVGMTLGLGKNVKKSALELLRLSDETKMPRGVKIDYRLKEDKSFDYARTLRSVMSFMLAGVENTNIAYGSVESLALFLRDSYDELLAKKQVQIAVVSGSLFEHKSLLKNVLKHLKNCKISDVPLYI
ncbi:hypothetical protein DMB92_05930 [Campylobacter sp. MIT 99-7217]|uniref:hypothetical protein n=1 Tax=Campylobacter sp. MIT 99-7217 TaxID=535091 RepID=UPI0011572E82|nr:hypothetical protein [Campylobacter sp. MIT 99-7217]TQR31947.1 hypothetical protein DMB92_05930 [Campylobacter sp. MIT 99-7217]